MRITNPNITSNLSYPAKREHRAVIVSHPRQLRKGRLLGTGSQYRVYVIHSSPDQVVKVPRPIAKHRDSNEDFLGDRFSRSAAEAVIRSGWSKAFPTKIERHVIVDSRVYDHVLLQDLCKHFLWRLVREAVRGRRWKDVAHLIDRVFDCELSAWQSGIFFQDTKSFFRNFVLRQGEVFAADFSSCTNSVYLAELWLRSPWSVDRQRAIILMLGQQQCPPALFNHVVSRMRWQYNIHQFWYYWK